MSLGDWLRSWLGEDRPRPPAILTEAEAAERVKAYAAANGYVFEEPVSVELKKRASNAKNPQTGQTGPRYIYVFALGSKRPMPFVEVDAIDGTVLTWRSLSR